jgi:hypothetical protein
MKYLILIIFAGLLLTSIASIASDITCYRGEELVYKGKASHIWIGEGYIDFVNSDNKRMYIPGKCIIKSDNDKTWG